MLRPIRQLSKHHLKELRRLHDKKFRRKTRLFLIEGVRLCEEALAAHTVIQEIIVWQDQPVTQRAQKLLLDLQERQVPFSQAKPEQLAALAATESPSGLLAVARQPDPPPLTATLKKSALLLALDGISDPGNMGTILRTASWFGVQSVFLSPMCVEVYNPKVVRSAMGAHFNLNLYEETDISALIEQSRMNDYRIIAAYTEQGIPLSALPPHDNNLIVIGNEAHGISKELHDRIDLSVTIPRSGFGESLNAAIAAAIILYEIVQKKS